MTNDNNRSLKVFLCHSSGDKLKVRKLYHRLIAEGFNVWFDEAKLLPGQEWDLEIRKAVRESDAVIVCLSSNSVTKAGYVQKEIRFTLDVAEEKPEGTVYLIPAKLEECAVPSQLSRYHWVNLFEKFGYKKLTDTLTRSADNLQLHITADTIFPMAVTTEEIIRVPVVGRIFASVPAPAPHNWNTDYYDLASSINITRSLLPPHEKGTDIFALEVLGDSMTDAMVNEGDIIILKEIEKANDGEMVAIWLRDKDETTLKYFYKEGKRIRLQPANPTMKPMYIEPDTARIIGKVVMVIRKVAKPI
jgi:SOS-response transcriptional repressor LexA